MSSLFGEALWHVSVHFPKLQVCEDKPKSDLPAGESYNIHTVMKEEGAGLKADARQNDFALQMREKFGQVTQMATCQLLNNS